jgi:hypothetical protein
MTHSGCTITQIFHNLYVNKLPLRNIIDPNKVLCILSLSQSHELAVSGKRYA